MKEFSKTTDAYRVIGISTKHLPHDDLIRLESSSFSSQNTMVLSRDSGFFVKLDSDKVKPLLDMSDFFNTICLNAYESGFKMIEFDDNATTYDSIPLFEDGSNTPIGLEHLINKYIVSLSIEQDGYSKVSRQIIEATTKHEATKKALLGECHDAIGDGAEFTETGMSDANGSYKYSVSSCNLIAQQDVHVLESYFV